MRFELRKTGMNLSIIRALYRHLQHFDSIHVTHVITPKYIAQFIAIKEDQLSAFHHLFNTILPGIKVTIEAPIVLPRCVGIEVTLVGLQTTCLP